MRKVVLIASFIASLSALGGVAQAHHVPPGFLRDAKVTVSHSHLPRFQCQELRLARPKASCALTSTIRFLRKRLAIGAKRLPLGTARVSSYPSGYWGWQAAYSSCSVVGCINQYEWGDANGRSVWQWGHSCWPTGLNTSVGQCYVTNNGGQGGFPYAEFVVRGSFTLAWPFNITINVGYGQLINDWGNVVWHGGV